ncbi:MAG: amylo-alpha-1,6-glucosidase [Bacteroidales bacterium]|nr:amylo-alpha-1,6-glucosidase [Bacteroidales bacterium]
MTGHSLTTIVTTDMDYSLGRDIIRNNLYGASSSTSIVLCNSRSWHGIFSIYDQQCGRNKVLLSTLDDSVVVGGNTYYLSVRKYPDIYFPLGYQYISAITFNPYVAVEYTLGDDAVIRKEMVLADKSPVLYVKYSVLSANKPVKVCIRPIVAFRYDNELRRCTKDIITGNMPINNGIAYHTSESEPLLYMQTSMEGSFVTAPDWNYNIEYPVDHKEGKPYQEDLFMPGFFEVELRSSQEVIFSASLNPQQISTLAAQFRDETLPLKKHTTYDSCLAYAANQMFRYDDTGYHVVENFPPSKFKTKDVCGALPGLTLPNGDVTMFRNVVKSFIEVYSNVLLTGLVDLNYAPETPLWFVWAIQQYSYQQNDRYKIFREYGSFVRHVINQMMSGNMSGLFIDTNGLLSVKEDKKRVYYAEINAMWHNSLMFFAELCNYAKLPDEANNAAKLARIMRASYMSNFYCDKGGYFCNSFDSDGHKDCSFRTGQLLAYALPYAVADIELTAKVLPMIEEKLLTPVGLRVLSVDDPKYATEGSISPFYLGFMVEIYIRVMGADGIKKAKEIYNSFNTELNDIVPPSFYERYSAEPPYVGIGSPLSAVTIANLNRIRLLIEQF